MSLKIAVMPGDGIGIEIVAEAVKILNHYKSSGRIDVELEEAPVGGAGYDAAGKPLPDETLALARASDAILFGAIGGPEYDGLARELRPERGLLALRSELELFANLRPAILYPQLADASSLKARGSIRPRYHDRSRIDRRYLFRRTTRHRDRCFG